MLWFYLFISIITTIQNNSNQWMFSVISKSTFIIFLKTHSHRQTSWKRFNNIKITEVSLFVKPPHVASHQLLWSTYHSIKKKIIFTGGNNFASESALRNNVNFGIKGTVSVISIQMTIRPPWKEGNSRFTTIPLNPLYIRRDV